MYSYLVYKTISEPKRLTRYSQLVKMNSFYKAKQYFIKNL